MLGEHVAFLDRENHNKPIREQANKGKGLVTNGGYPSVRGLSYREPSRALKLKGGVEGRRALLRRVEEGLKQTPGDQRTQGLEKINLEGLGPRQGMRLSSF